MPKKKTKKKAKKPAKKTPKKVAKKTSKKVIKKKTAKVGNGPYPPVDVCCGGTVSVGSSYVPFSNATGVPQTVSNCQLWNGAAAIAAGVNPTPVPITINPPPQKGAQ